MRELSERLQKLVQFFNDTPIGTKVQITTHNPFGDYTRTGYYANAPLKHGYLMDNDKGWCWQPTENSSPCYYIGIKETKRSKSWALAINEIKDIKVLED